MTNDRSAANNRNANPAGTNDVTYHRCWNVVQRWRRAAYCMNYRRSLGVGRTAFDPTVRYPVQQQQVEIVVSPAVPRPLLQRSSSV